MDTFEDKTFNLLVELLDSVSNKTRHSLFELEQTQQKLDVVVAAAASHKLHIPSTHIHVTDTHLEMLLDLQTKTNKTF
jgi:hypothetical protein